MGKERKVAARTNVQIGLASAHGPRRPSPRPWIFMDVGYWILGSALQTANLPPILVCCKMMTRMLQRFGLPSLTSVSSTFYTSIVTISYSPPNRIKNNSNINHLTYLPKPSPSHTPQPAAGTTSSHITPAHPPSVLAIPASATFFLSSIPANSNSPSRRSVLAFQTAIERWVRSPLRSVSICRILTS